LTSPSVRNGKIEIWNAEDEIRAEEEAFWDAMDDDITGLIEKCDG
jgi:hypothetical protein